MKHRHNANLVQTSGSATCGGQSVNAAVNLDKSVAGVHSAEASLNYPGRDLGVSAKARQVEEGTHKILFNANWAKDEDSKMSVASTWLAGETHRVTSEVQIPGYPVTVSVTVKWVHPFGLYVSVTSFVIIEQEGGGGGSPFLGLELRLTFKGFIVRHVPSTITNE